MKGTQCAVGEWKQISIRTHADLINGFAFPSEEFTEGEGLPLIRIRDLERQETEVNYRGKYNSRYLIKKDDLLIGMDGDFVTVKWKGDNALLNQRVCKLTTKNSDCLLQDFLYYRIIEEIHHINRVTAATTVKHLSSADILGIKIELPSKPEQTKIAEILSTVDRAIEQTEELIAKQQRIKTGLMQDLLTRGIDDHANLRTEQIHKFKDSLAGRIPEEWDARELGAVAYVTKLAGFEFTNYFDYRIGGDVIALRALNIKNERLDLADIQRIPKAVSEKLPRSKIYADDILITYIGAYIGDVLRIEENDKYHLAPNIAKIVAGRSLFPEFLEASLRSSFVQRQIKNLTAVTATPSLTMTQIRKLHVAIPKDTNEQAEIALRIGGMRKALNMLELRSKKLRSLKTALMQDLLTGKRRVTTFAESEKSFHS